MVITSIAEIKKEILKLIFFLELTNDYIQYTLIFLCITVITAAIHLSLINLAICISSTFFPKQTSILIKIWDRLDNICIKILKIIPYFVSLWMFIWLLINVLSFIARIDLFFTNLYNLIISVLIHLSLSLILVFVTIMLIKIFDNQFLKLILNTRYITHYLLLLLNILTRSILTFTPILLFLFLLLHSSSSIDYCTEIITCYM